MTTVAWFHCFSGIAGDMTLGALFDAGADVNEVRELLGQLPVRGWELDVEPTMRNGIASTRVQVRVVESAVVRTYGHIAGLIEEARLPERVRQRALATFRRLAEVEGRLHRRPPEQVHFHEVGGLDAVVDIVGVSSALEVLGVDRVHSSPVAQGMGMIRSAHGTLPNPPPAVVELLRGAPTYGIDLAVELTTPTGAALLAALTNEWGPLPAMRVDRTGFGAGTRELPNRPNLVQVVIGEERAAPVPGQPVVLIEVNVDDVTGETLAHTIAALLDGGAHDAWIVPIVMKKGRPAHTVKALADPALAEQVARVMVSETGSLGVRATTLERWPQARTIDAVEVAGYPLRVKVSAGRVKVEPDDAARVARSTGMPLREVISLAEAAARRRETDGPKPEPEGPDGDTRPPSA